MSSGPCLLGLIRAMARCVPSRYIFLSDSPQSSRDPVVCSVRVNPSWSASPSPEPIYSPKARTDGHRLYNTDGTRPRHQFRDICSALHPLHRRNVGRRIMTRQPASPLPFPSLPSRGRLRAADHSGRPVHSLLVLTAAPSHRRPVLTRCQGLYREGLGTVQELVVVRSTVEGANLRCGGSAAHIG